MIRLSCAHRLAICAACIALGAAVWGCAKKPPSTAVSQYQTVGKDPRRDTDAARAKNAEALDAMARGNYDRAESLLKAALTADIMFGPAHNNLGKVYYRQEKRYLAAWEFEYAAKLMPHQAEPRNNLGLVFESAGRLDEAVNHYKEALALDPENPEVIGNTARARIRRGDDDAEVRDLLGKLVMRDTRQEWVEWARRRLVLAPSPSATQPKP